MEALSELEVKTRYLELLKQKQEMREGLPFLHGWKHYTWSRAFYESRNRFNFLVAANQIGKSSTQIRKCINWATDKTLWPSLWKTRPLTFWYLYPTKEVATIEFTQKWVPEFMPRGKFKEDPVYGWRAEFRNKNIFAIHFFSGVSVYFKSYGMDEADLQTGTVWALFLDEELPEHLYSELNMRVHATRGYYHNVFTATLGCEMWRETMEPTNQEKERFPDAFKIRVSMYDCLQYEDGSLGPITEKEIVHAINSCKSDAEVQRRIFGRFVLAEGLKYPAFDRNRNVSDPVDIPRGWHVYAGVDIGSGGDKAHPAAIVFVVVNPDFSKGYAFRGWRGDGISTTASDILMKYLDMRGDIIPVGQYYDWQSKDFFNIASRMGVPFIPAEKSHDIGEQILNVLFRNSMLIIYDIPELKPLCTELCNLQKDTPKTKAKDDYCDALRYAVTKIPWNWSVINSEKVIEVRNDKSEAQRRRETSLGREEDFDDEGIEAFNNTDEFEEWNSYNE